MKNTLDLKTIFANNLKIKRKKMKLTQAELAKKIDVSASFITEIENGRKAPSFSNIEKIAAVLNTPCWTLFIENGDQFDLSFNEKELISFELKMKLNKSIDDFFTEKMKK
ncbi:MAG: helix-turn-helix domain-containing protein [Pleomorphochaeta sp.]